MPLLRLWALLAIVASIGPSTGCGAPPEQRISDLLEEARAAAEEGDLRTLEGMLSVDFVDDHGNDRSAVLAMVGYYVQVEGGLRIWMRIDEIEISQSRKALVRLLVALAGGPIERPQDLIQLRAEVHRFDLDLKEDTSGSWQLTHATWTRASLADVL